MSRKYYFYYNYKKTDIITLLTENINANNIIENCSTMNIKVDKECITIKERSIHPHALQRAFKGKIYDDGNKCYIKGSFKYPYFNSLLFIIFFCIIFIKNIEMLADNVPISIKYQASLIFTIFYIFDIAMFLSGIILFKKQEFNVLQFLGNLGAG